MTEYYRVTFTRVWHGCGYTTDYSVDIDIHPLKFEEKNKKLIMVNGWNKYTEKDFCPDIEDSRQFLRREVAVVL